MSAWKQYLREHFQGQPMNFDSLRGLSKSYCLLSDSEKEELKYRAMAPVTPAAPVAPVPPVPPAAPVAAAAAAAAAALLDVMEIDRVFAVDGEPECVVCMERKSNCVAIVDCGHTSVCNVCLQNLESCPVCRATITQVIRIYN